MNHFTPNINTIYVPQTQFYR